MHLSLKTLLSLSAVLLALALMQPPAQAQEPLPGADSQPAFVPGELLVKFKPGLTTQDDDLSLANVGGQVIDRLEELEVVTVSVARGSEQSSAAKLQSMANVEFAEPNYLAYAQYIPDDLSSSIYGQWGMFKINTPDMLDITSGSSNVIVAVVDTGIDLDHPDFSCTVSGGLPKLTAGATFVTETITPDDDNSHGSHVAGIIGACTNNAIGVTGVAPEARLMPVKVLNYAGSGSYGDVANGIVWAVNNGAKIINLSLGGASGSSTIYDAVKYAYDNGVLVVAASGNSSSSYIMYPAAYAETMAVGATDINDVRATYSNYGIGLNVVAPGTSIYSTSYYGGYTSKSGTSMATPFVAGLAAVILGLDPDLTHTQVQSLIQNNAVDLGNPGYDELYGYGRIDAFATVESLLIEQFQLPVSQNIVPPITFLTDDETPPGSHTVTIPTSNVSWQAAMSPPVSWASVSVGQGGTLETTTTGALLTINATRPDTYGQFSASLILTGTLGVSPTTQNIGPFTIHDAVTIKYVPQLQRLYLPLILRN